MNNPENPQELLECFDEQENVIEPKTRGEIHLQPLQFWHGVVNVWLVNSAGELLCSKRSETLSGNPGKWQTFFGGHLKAGKSYVENAILELDEEVGLKIEPSKLFLVEEGQNFEHKHFFESYAYLFNGAVSDLKFNDGEVADVKWYGMEDYWIDRTNNPDNWCNGCKPDNQRRIKAWLKSSVEILGVKINDVTKEQALQKALEFLNSTDQHKIFTPNPEMVVKAQKDEDFKRVLNTGDLNLCDGVGLQIFTKIKRVPGVDFMMELCQLAAEQGRGVYLLGSGSDEVVGGAFEQLEKKYPGLEISGYNKGPEINENPACRFDGPIFEQINQSGAQILFVAFGMGKQEKWISENLSKMPGVKIAMGVGGSFDFISGKIKRAPLFLRRLGLEWLYRLIQQPSRIGRIFNATVKFTYLVLRSKCPKF